MALEIKVDVKIANYRDIIKLAAENMARMMKVRAQLDVATVGRRFIKRHHGAGEAHHRRL